MDQLELLRFTIDVLERLSIRYAIVGAFASGVYGEPRQTHEGLVAAPEDVILGKLVYFKEGGSEKHLRDITGMLRISSELIDRDFIARFAEKLDVADVWDTILRRLNER